MCGIVGIWNRDRRPVDRGALRAAVSSLTPRGPDDEGYVLIDTRTGHAVACRGPDTQVEGLPSVEEANGEFDLALGHRRLAIVDATVTGHQPMSTTDGRLWIVFNGMIYNFADLRRDLERAGNRFHSRSDTEVILHSYRRWGPDCVSRFNGMWSFLLWDARARELLVSRDRLGIKPLIYRIDAERAAFASDLAALHPFAANRDGVEPRALHHYLSLLQVPAPYTINKGVLKLHPARNLRVGLDRVVENRYWGPSAQARVAADAGEAAEQLDELLADAVRLQLVGDVPIGAFVSGGIDSGTVAAIASMQTHGRPLPTYSIAVPSEPRVDEARWSRSIASRIGSNHRQIDLAAGDLESFLRADEQSAEPFAVSSVLGVNRIAHAAHPRVRVLLSGDGGDELFAGYTHRHAAVDERWDHLGRKKLARLRSERASAAGQWVRWRGRTRSTMHRLRIHSLFTSDASGRDFQVMHRRCTFNDHEKHALYSPTWRDGFVKEDTIPWLQSMIPPCDGDRVLRRQLHDLDTILPDEMTAKLDRGTMAWGVECRVPLLDHRVVELALSLPLEHRYMQGEGKRLLRRVAARYLPAEILARPKQGFTMPIASWLGNELRAMVYDTLSPAAVRRSGVFEPACVEEVLAYHEREPTSRTARMVFALLCFQIWHDRWASSPA